MGKFGRIRKNINSEKQGKPDTGMIKLIMVSASVLIAGVLLFAIMPYVYEIWKNEAVVVTINNEPVTFSEFRQVMQGKRADVLSYFKQKHGVDYEAKFWTNTYGGEIPLEKIKRDTLDELVKIKVQQILAREYGIVSDISYRKFLTDLKDENRRRENALRENQPIYGPKQYSESVYYDVFNSNLFFALKEKITKNIELTDEEMKQFYEANRENLFKKAGSTSTQIIALPFTSGVKREEAEAGAKEIKARIDKGESFEKLADIYAEGYPFRIELIDHTFEPSSTKGDSMKWPRAAAAAKKLDVGQVSDIVEDNGSFYIIKCTGKTPESYTEFNDAKESIFKIISEQRYEDEIDKLVKDASVEINHRVYGAIKEDDLL